MCERRARLGNGDKCIRVTFLVIVSLVKDLLDFIFKNTLLECIKTRSKRNGNQCDASKHPHFKIMTEQKLCRHIKFKIIDHFPYFHIICPCIHE